MNGTYLKNKSWEKQSFFALDNGCEIIVEYGHYGPMVTSVIKNDKVVYHCSSDFACAPEWVRNWVKPVSPGSWQKIIVPEFNKIYN